MKNVFKKWQKLPADEKLRIQALIIAGMLVFYAPFLYMNKQANDKAIAMVHRKQNRIDTQVKIDKLPAMGRSTEVLQGLIVKAEKKLHDITSSFDELDTGFAPIESTEVQQQLMLEISKLAERSGVELLSVVRKGVDSSGNLTLNALDDEVGRPLLALRAYSSYTGLLRFLYGFKELSFYASAMDIDVYSGDFPNDSKKKRGGQSEVVDGSRLAIVLEICI